MIARSRIVTLTTDFGTADTFVGEMKGAILAVDPDLRIVDVTHAVRAHDVAGGALALDVGSRPFPPGTVHVAVVDPGVGSARRAVAVETADAFWVGPDNGVLARALRRRAIVRAHAIEAPGVRRASAATTFDGRDLFAPAAARIACGADLASLGPAADGLAVATPAPAPAAGGPAVVVDVVHVDRFGNVFLDVERDDAGDDVAPEVDLGPGGTVRRLVRAYAEANDERPVLVWNAAGLLEIAVREGRASERLGLGRGDRVRVRLVATRRGRSGA